MTPSERRWLELSVRCAAAGDLEPLLAEGLVGVGGRAVQEVDGWYVTHVEEPGDTNAFLEKARSALVDLVGGAEVETRTRWIDHEDWAETWKRGLEPRRITPRLVVTTSWQPVQAGPGEVVLVIDPGMAFGTAEHGTTRGCLRLLDGRVSEGDRVLDIGAGSGILSIAAAHLGASEVVAVEGDPLAVEALAENVELNGAAGTVRWETAWADAKSLARYRPRDGVVANIESLTLKPLLAGFAAALRSGGWLILSGILAEEWSWLRADAEATGFRFEALDQDGPWRSALFTRL